MTRRSRSAGEPTPGSPADLQPDADPSSVARAIVLRRLSAAPRTRAELSTDLAKRGVPEDVAREVLDRFEDVHLIDDAAFAHLWVESRHRGKGVARSVLRQELRRKGVDDDTIAAALQQVSDESEADRARALVERKLPSLARYDRATQERRLASLLMRRGYSGGLAGTVVRDVLGGVSEEA